MISNLKNAINTFEIDNGRFPTTAEGLNSLVDCPPGLENSWHKLVDEIPKDKWGHPFIYRCPSATNPDDFDLISIGPDGILGTKDDISKNDHDDRD
ncbi:MAG TPA: type II secretion system protein GspG [Phycisphaerae bacterium]